MENEREREKGKRDGGGEGKGTEGDRGGRKGEGGTWYNQSTPVRAGTRAELGRGAGKRENLGKRNHTLRRITP